MLILGIDTSDGVSVALVRDHAVLARVDGADPRRHAETLAPGIEWVLGEAGVDRRELDAVAVGTGPAPFTGLRVGLVTARTLARALAIPAYGVCSLDALARQAYDTLGPDGPDTVLAVADARRREVYAALYQRGTAPLDDVHRTAGPVVARAADVFDALGPLRPGSLGGEPRPRCAAGRGGDRRRRPRCAGVRGVAAPHTGRAVGRGRRRARQAGGVARRPGRGHGPRAAVPAAPGRHAGPGAQAGLLRVAGTVTGDAMATGLEMGLRPMTVSDLPRVAELERELFGVGAWSLGMLQEELSAPGRTYVAAEVAGRVVGYAGLAAGADAEVMTIGVEPARRRRGIGAALLESLVRAAREARCGRVFLEVRTDADGARRLYERAGFRPVGIRKGYYQAEGADALVMRLDLLAPGPVGAKERT